MGTNYYWHEKPPCSSCGRKYEPLHIGKSSAGWCFALHIIPEEDINDLPDWQKLWDTPGSLIFNEYGDILSPAAMTGVITIRKCSLRHSYCTKHGSGTWDCIEGEFS